MTDDVTRVNQDLAGFLTSIISDRFLDSYRLLLHWYQQNNTRHATTFTVARSESLPDAQVHRGSHRHMSHTTTTRLHRRSLHIQQFPNIISSILELNYFMVGQRVLRQIRGAPMGSPASPALCSMVVAVHEQAWAITYKTSVQCRACETRPATPQHRSCHLLRDTLRGQQVNDDPHQDDWPPTLRAADPQRLLRATGGTGGGAPVQFPRNGAGSRRVCHPLHTANPA